MSWLTKLHQRLLFRVMASDQEVLWTTVFATGTKSLSSSENPQRKSVSRSFGLYPVLDRRASTSRVVMVPCRSCLWMQEWSIRSTWPMKRSLYCSDLTDRGIMQHWWFAAFWITSSQGEAGGSFRIRRRILKRVTSIFESWLGVR